MDASHFVVNDQVRFQYAGLFVMYVIHKESYQFTLTLHPSDKVLEPIIEWLKGQDYIQVGGNFYVLSSRGEKVLDTFLDRYKTFLDEFDIFCGVDLEQKEFAFTYYDSYDDLDEWHQFLADDRWEDLRIAVAEYKGLDPIEIVLMSLIHEGRFGRDEDGVWCEDLLLGSIWDEIQSICNTAVRLKSLRQELLNRDQSSDTFMKDIIKRGNMIMEGLRR